MVKYITSLAKSFATKHHHRRPSIFLFVAETIHLGEPSTVSLFRGGVGLTERIDVCNVCNGTHEIHIRTNDIRMKGGIQRYSLRL